MKNEDKILLIGIGNSGRSDDALGWLFLDRLSEDDGTSFDMEYRYQLQIEDAELIGRYAKVFFVDATMEYTRNGYLLKPCRVNGNHTFTTHQLTPEAVLYLCKTLYGETPDAYIFGIQGYIWDLKIGLSEKAESNIAKAIAYFTHIITDIKVDY